MSVESRRALGRRYELVERLGSGAMGEVWRVSDRDGGPDAAAKLLRREFTADPDILGRFIQERSILVALDHPNIVRVHDLVVEGDDVAIVMDLAHGGSLGDLLRECGTFAPRQACAIAAAILDGLAYAHKNRALHRDIKPDNVLVADRDVLGAGVVKLSDFGIARLAQESTVQSTGLLGTPAYMPPELLTEGTFSAASDVYATGVLLYELLAGRTPFAGPGNAHTVGYRHIQMAPPELPVATELWRVLAIMLSKDPKRRLTATATAAALRALPGEVFDRPALPVQAEPKSWVPTTEDVAQASPGPIHVREVQPDVDVGETNLTGEPVEVAPMAREGAVETVAPGRHVADDPQATQLGVTPARPGGPVLIPEATHVATKRRLWVWAVSGVAAVAVVVLAVIFLPRLPSMGLGRSAGTDEVKPVEIGSPASGLLTNLTGKIVDGDHAQLEFGFSSKVNTLDGDLLIMVPPMSKDDPTCPSVPGDWSGGKGLAVDDVTAGGCGFTLRTSEPITSSEQTMSAEFEIELKDERELTDWIGRIKDATERALAEERADESSFAIQRITGVNVVPIHDSYPPTNQRVVVEYTVWPLYGDQEAQTDELVTNVGAQTNLLRQLVGDLDDEARGQVGVTADPKDCPNGNAKGLRLVLDSPGTCTFTVRVGLLEGQGTVSVQAAVG